MGLESEVEMLTRTTVSPRLAASTAASIISVWAPSAFPGNFFAMRTWTLLGMRARTASGTSLSDKTRSASLVRAVWVAMVRSEGCPGPEPTSRILPRRGRWREWIEGVIIAPSTTGDAGGLSPAKTSCISSADIRASFEIGQYSLI